MARGQGGVGDRIVKIEKIYLRFCTNGKSFGRLDKQLRRLGDGKDFCPGE
jgi:hypothetical protein